MASGKLQIRNEFEGEGKEDHRFVIIQITDGIGHVVRVTVDAGEFNRALAKPGSEAFCAIETEPK